MKFLSKTTATGGEEGKGLRNLTVTFLVASVFAMVVTYILVAYWDRQDKQYISLLGEQRVLSQQLTKDVGVITSGNEGGSFTQLRASYEQFERQLDMLKDGDEATGLPSVPAELQAQWDAVNKAWEKVDTSINTIFQHEQSVADIRGRVATINEKSGQLLAFSDEVATLMAQGARSSPQQTYIATRQLMLSQRIVTNVNRVLEGGEGSVTAADRFGRDAALFGRVLKGLMEGDPKNENGDPVKGMEIQGMQIERIPAGEAREKLEKVNAVFNEIRTNVGEILRRSPEMFQVTEAVVGVLKDSDELLKVITDLDRAYHDYASRRAVISYFGTGFGIIALVLLVVLGYQQRQEGLRRLTQAETERRVVEERNKRNQQAIMRLLDEMGDLADGDLTVNATVTEDITGAIADSMNYAIEALRTLVAKINQTVVEVSAAAQVSQATAAQLAEASNHQAKQITSASTAINEMAGSIEGVSKNATKLATEAKKSVDIARQGTEAVQKTIKGMDSIREQIQETSKRIKRLGESSQEIGDIVELINDIAEQTNILALNAAIQAAMAGEAGRGFAVVADEVQRLAERSADATKQIEGLVKTIQSDTNEAVVSMEQSTTGVVAGARLAEDAGAALAKIDTVANELAALIENISGATRQQASAASSVSDTMNVIQEITTQTSAGTSQTSAAIRKLAELANELKKSVAGFKLPA